MKHLLKYRLLRTATAVLLLATLCAGALRGADLKAGFGRRQITPPLPILMAGFENRTKPAESIATDLWTKALTLEDPSGRKVVVITVDLVTMPRAMIDLVAARVTDRHGLDRSQLVINMSHTHSGPMLDWPTNTDREMMLRIETYRNKVIDSMAEAAADAVADLQPAKVTYATGKVGLQIPSTDAAVSRRRLGAAAAAPSCVSSASRPAIWAKHARSSARSASPTLCSSSVPTMTEAQAEPPESRPDRQVVQIATGKPRKR